MFLLCGCTAAIIVPRIVVIFSGNNKTKASDEKKPRTRGLSHVRFRFRLQGVHERDEIGLLLLVQFQLQHHIEELDGVIEGDQAPVVQVGR